MVTGALPRDRALGLRDGGGTSMAEAMAAAGQDPLTSGGTRRRCTGSGASCNCLRGVKALTAVVTDLVSGPGGC
jgi:hypothetical protein